jgi:hypothetical protein
MMTWFGHDQKIDSDLRTLRRLEACERKDVETRLVRAGPVDEESVAA